MACLLIGGGLATVSLSRDLASDPPPPPLSSSSSSSSPWTSPLHHDSAAVDLFTTVSAGRPGAEAAGPRGGGGGEGALTAQLGAGRVQFQRAELRRLEGFFFPRHLRAAAAALCLFEYWERRGARARDNINPLSPSMTAFDRGHMRSTTLH